MTDYRCLPTSRDRFSKLKKADVSTLLIKYIGLFPILLIIRGLLVVAR